ncbi:UrcA family protein [Brevundimonas sp. BR2-1]|uniref:UrcA family protein n=1 Tax=unclassified Brevundimonas TaxID=2622653 RepID=UPI002FC61D82
MITSILIAAVLATGSVELREPPVMQVSATGLNLSDARDAAVFADRVVEQSRRFCALHLERITPEHPANPRFCERGMAEEAVRALPEAHRQRFRAAGGPALVYRRLR